MSAKTANYILASLWALIIGAYVLVLGIRSMSVQTDLGETWARAMGFVTPLLAILVPFWWRAAQSQNVPVGWAGYVAAYVWSLVHAALLFLGTYGRSDVLVDNLEHLATYMPHVQAITVGMMAFMFPSRQG